MPPGRLVAVIAGAIARRLDRVLDGDDEDAVSTPWPGRPATTGAATSADGGGAGHPAREPRPDGIRARTAEGPGQQKGPVTETGPFPSGAGGTNCTYVFLLEEGCSATELRLRGVANRSNSRAATSKRRARARRRTTRAGPGRPPCRSAGVGRASSS